MPNHVKNIITMYGDETNIKRILNQIKYEGENENKNVNTIDFNKLLPMPKELGIAFGSDLNNSLALYLTKLDPSVTYYGDMDKKLDKSAFDELVNNVNKQKNSGIYEYEPLKEDRINKLLQNDEEEKYINFAKTAIDNITKYGHATWYTWHRENWGTKWNAYDFEKGNDNQVIFHTAWSPSLPVIIETSRLNPEITFKHEYADECFGYNCGALLIKHGCVMQNYIPDDYSKEAFDFSLKIHNLTYSDINMVPSFDKTTLIPLREDYTECYVKDHRCIGTQTMVTPDKVPAGYAMYFYDNNEISSICTEHSKGIILSDETFDLDKNGTMKIEPGDISFTENKISLETYFSDTPNIYLDNENEMQEELNLEQQLQV